MSRRGQAICVVHEAVTSAASFSPLFGSISRGFWPTVHYRHGVYHSVKSGVHTPVGFPPLVVRFKTRICKIAV